MRSLDRILSNAAINAIILASYCAWQFIISCQGKSYFMAVLNVFAAYLCARDAMEALTYKHKEV